MPYTAATKLPTLNFFQWSTPSAPNPRLASPIDSDDTTLTFTSPPLDRLGAVITGNFLIGVTNSDSYTETIYVPPAGMSVDGLTATGCVRGVRPTGIDYTTGDASFAASHNQDSPVICNVTAVYELLLQGAIQGTIATNGLGLILGDETNGNATISQKDVASTKGFLRKNPTTAKVQYSNDGAVWVNIDSVSASNLVAVSAADTTPSYLATKGVAGDGLDESITTPGGDERWQLDVDVTDFIDTSYGLTENANDIRINLHATPGLEFSGGALKAKVKAAGGITLDANGLSLTEPNTFTGVAGEAINGSVTPQALAIGGTTFKQAVRTNTAANAMVFWDGGSEILASTNMGGVDATAKFAQSFTFTDASAETITIEKISIMIGKVGAPADNLTLTIMTDAAGVPNNTVIANGTSNVVSGAGVSTANGYGFNTFTFATPPTITSDTTYWWVVNRSAALDAANYYRIGRHNSSLITGNFATYTASTTTWSSGGTNDAYFDMRLNLNYNGQAFKADSDNYSKCKFMGFTSSNVADAGAPTIQSSGVVTMSGLTPGATYYASDTAGAITTTPSGSNCLIPVGEAVSTTQLLLNRGLRVARGYYATIKLTTTTNSTTVNADLFTPTGFKPIFISIAADLPGDTNQNGTGVYKYTYGVESPSGYINSMGSTIVTLQTTASASSGAGTTGMGFDTSTYIAVSNIYENGFDLNFVTNDADHYASNVYITAYGY